MISGIGIVFVIFIVGSSAQRSPYAGRSPIGYPTVAPEQTTVTTQRNDLGNRFNNGSTTQIVLPSVAALLLPVPPTVPTTTERLPIEAMGDRALFQRLKQLPFDRQPFWLLNFRALEEYRRKPQVYAPKSNPFVDQTSWVGASGAAF